jgi:hypothetical protein
MPQIIIRSPGSVPPSGDLAVHVDDSMLVGQLRAMIAERHPLQPPAPTQRLILGARVLEEADSASVLAVIQRVRRVARAFVRPALPRAATSG